MTLQALGNPVLLLLLSGQKICKICVEYMENVIRGLSKVKCIIYTARLTITSILFNILLRLCECLFIFVNLYKGITIYKSTINTKLIIIVQKIGFQDRHEK